MRLYMHFIIAARSIIYIYKVCKIIYLFDLFTDALLYIQYMYRLRWQIMTAVQKSALILSLGKARCFKQDFTVAIKVI